MSGSSTAPSPTPRRLRARAVLALAAGLFAAAVAWAQPPAELTLRIVGGLGGVNQFTRHEEPFWARQLAALSQGRYRAEVVPFDRAGLRAQEMLALVQQGAVPFGTALLSVAAGRDPALGAPDLAGLSPDMATLRRVVAAARPTLTRQLRERYGIELLALYVYPAQVAFCRQPLSGLGDLAGRRVRTSSPTQADWVTALGATPVPTPFAEIVANLSAGNIDCAITGTMSGYTIGLHEVTSHVQGTAVNWGLSLFVAHGASWAALPAELRTLLQRELPRLEQAVWDESERETGQGIACNTGAADCGGKRGRMTAVAETPADAERRRRVFAEAVLARWVERCGAACATQWNQTLAPVVGVRAALPR